MTFSKPSRELHNQPALTEKVSLEAKGFFDQHGCTVALVHDKQVKLVLGLKNKQLLVLDDFQRLIL